MPRRVGSQPELLCHHIKEFFIMCPSKLAIVAAVAFVAFESLKAQNTTTPTPEQIQVRQAGAAVLASEHPLMPIGTSAPDFSLKGTDDKVHTLAEFSKSKVLVVMFESIHCPVSENYEGRMRALYDQYNGKDVAFVAINPNNPS